jgi:hypothetical protein
MQAQLNLEEIHAEIQSIKKSADELIKAGDSFPSLSRNATRILASTKMLELNISDLVELG